MGYYGTIVVLLQQYTAVSGSTKLITRSHNWTPTFLSVITFRFYPVPEVIRSPDRRVSNTYEKAWQEVEVKHTHPLAYEISSKGVGWNPQQETNVL